MTTSYNTYIGARYVPIIDGAWDNTKEYEPLIIVTYQGDSYTSKTYVPAGIDISNENYWVCTGNYNAQVEAYRAEVNSLTQDFTELQGEFNNLKVVNVKDYGATGDGQTDDSQAFQNALNSGYDVYIPLNNKEHYIISETLNVLTNRQMIFSNTSARDSSQAVYNQSKIIYTGTGALFNCTGTTGVYFYGLTAETPNPSTSRVGTFALLDATSIEDNCDCKIDYCLISGFDIGADVYGRGFRLMNSAMLGTNTMVRSHYTFNEETSDVNRTWNYGDRALIITNNRSHGCSWILEHISGHLYGAIITNNTSDIGTGCVQSYSDMYNCIISNNIHSFLNRYFIYARSGAYHGNVIQGNNCASNSTQNVSRFIFVRSECTEFDANIISDNIFEYSTADAILIEPDCTKNQIVNNEFIDIGTGATSESVACIRTHSISDTVISDNIMSMGVTNYPIRIVSDATCENVYVTDNVCNTHSGIFAISDSQRFGNSLNYIDDIKLLNGTTANNCNSYIRNFIYDRTISCDGYAVFTDTPTYTEYNSRYFVPIINIPANIGYIADSNYYYFGNGIFTSLNADNMQVTENCDVCIKYDSTNGVTVLGAMLRSNTQLTTNTAESVSISVSVPNKLVEYSTLT